MILVQQPHGFQGLLQVGDDVLRLLQADAEADEALAELLRVQQDPFVIAGLGENEAFIVAQGHGEGHHLQRSAKALHGLVVGIQAEGDDAAIAVAHLLLRHLIARVAGQARIGHEGDALLLFKPLGDAQAGGVDLPHTQGEGDGAPEDLPGVEGADHRAHVHLGLVADPVHSLQIVGDDGASLGVPVAVEILGQGVHHKVRAQLQGPLVQGRGKGVVHRQQRPVGMGDLRHGGDVRHAHGGVVRRLDMDQAGTGGNGLAHRVQIRHIHHHSIHAELFIEQLVKHPVDRHIAHIGVDHPVTGF